MKINTTKYKMILTIIISFTLLTFLLISFSYKQVSNNIIEAKLEHLSSLQKSKINELNNWFGNLNKLLISLSQQKMTRDAFKEFKDSFYSLENEVKNSEKYLKTKLLNDLDKNYLNKVNYDLPFIEKRRVQAQYLPSSKNGLIAQYLYTIKDKKTNINSSYSKNHEIYNSSYSKYLEAYNIYDIFMIDLNGNLIYSNIKEKDFATNLLNGVYKETGLSNVYKKALKVNRGNAVFEDFKPYEPSYNNSASFIATPIYINGKKEGVFAFQISINYLNKIINYDNDYEKVGLGKTGQNYLIGEDYKLRSDMRFLDKLNDKEIKNLYSLIGIKKVISPITKNIIINNLDKGSFILNDYKNDEVVSVFEKISMPSDIKWYILTELETSEVLEATNKFRDEMILISSMIFGLIGIFIIYYVGRIMNVLNSKEKELEELNNSLEKRVQKEVSKNLEKEIQLFESAKLAAMGSMIGNIIHQWKQPLNYISLIAGKLQLQAELNSKVEVNDLKHSTQNIISAVKKLSEITFTFRNFLKEKKEMKTIVLQDRIEDCLVISGTVLKDKNIELIKDIKNENPIKVETISSELSEVIINVINNAIDAIIENNINKGFVKISLIEKLDFITICIEDNGGGVPENVLANIFDEYFTTKTSDKGTGLGLYMSKKIVTESLKGKFYAKNSENGICFFIELPKK